MRTNECQPIGKILGGFEKYLPPEVPPLTPEQQEAERERASQQLQHDRRWRIAQGVSSLVEQAGKRFELASLDSYKAVTPAQRQAVAQLREYLSLCQAAKGTGLAFYGPVGTGKDHLAFSVCRELIERGAAPSLLWMNVQRWFSSLRDRMDQEQKTEATELRRLVAPAILVLSEVLPPFGTIGQHMATLLYLVVEERTARGVPTFATLNAANDQEAAERMGRPTWDRFCDNAGKIFCDWPSYRAPAWKVNC